jgi:hypothetical protein
MLNKIISKVLETDHSQEIADLKKRVDTLEKMCLYLGHAADETYTVLQIIEDIVGAKFLESHSPSKEELN